MIALINTGVANVASVLYALERLGTKATVTSDPEVILNSSHVILPGVGTANACMDNLKRAGIAQALPTLKVPVMGICLGMQLLYAHSDEGDADCLGIFKGTVQKLVPEGKLPVPHMGWNQVKLIAPSILLRGIKDETNFYFVHSFHVPAGAAITAVSNYGQVVPAVVEKDNWFGTQFHPERSGKDGEQILRNFLSL
jgi:glutamine amidotransferase